MFCGVSGLEPATFGPVSAVFKRTPLFFAFIDITAQKECTYIYENDNSYSYDEIWKDRLNHYNGVALTYDEQGNPLTYLGHTLTWEKDTVLNAVFVP